MRSADTRNERSSHKVVCYKIMVKTKYGRDLKYRSLKIMCWASVVRTLSSAEQGILSQTS